MHKVIAIFSDASECVSSLSTKSKSDPLPNKTLQVEVDKKLFYGMVLQILARSLRTPVLPMMMMMNDNAVVSILSGVCVCVLVRVVCCLQEVKKCMYVRCVAIVELMCLVCGLAAAIAGLIEAGGVGTKCLLGLLAQLALFLVPAHVAVCALQAHEGGLA